MLNLFTVNSAISQIIDAEMLEGGELTEETLEKVLALELQRDQLALDLAALAKQEYAVATAIREQARKLYDRAKAYEQRGEAFERTIARAIPAGTKLRDERAEISWRKSKAVNIVEETLLPEEYLRTEVTVEPDKKAIGEALKKGTVVPGAELEERTNLQVR